MRRQLCAGGNREAKEIRRQGNPNENEERNKRMGDVKDMRTGK